MNVNIPEGDNRPPAYLEGGNAIFRASSLDKCPMALTAMLLGFDPEPTPTWLEGAFEFGRTHEHLVVEKWLGGNRDWELESSQDEMEWEVGKGIVVRGHHDGIVVNKETGERMLLEVKWLGKDLFRAFMTGRLFEKIPSYHLQRVVYQKMSGGIPMTYLVGNKQWYKDNGEVLYEEKKFEWDEGQHQHELNMLAGKLAGVVAQAAKGELGEEPEGCGTGKYQLCPVGYLHGARERGKGETDTGAGPWETEGVEEVDDEQFRDVLARYHEIGKSIRKLETEKKTLGKVIRETLDGRKKVRSRDMQVTWVEQSRTSPDVKKMKEDGIFDEYKVEVKIGYPRVTSQEPRQEPRQETER